nr:uncharacterized mitochondrial protein AtMg00810-like [Tanacetum cinerariifolium]
VQGELFFLATSARVKSRIRQNEEWINAMVDVPNNGEPKAVFVQGISNIVDGYVGLALDGLGHVFSGLSDVVVALSIRGRDVVPSFLQVLVKRLLLPPWGLNFCSYFLPCCFFFRLQEGKLASTPIDTEKPLLKDPDGEDVDVHTYRSMIRSLMYLTSSRLDIMFAVCTCARFQVTPKASHLHIVKRIFRYLKGKPHLGLWYPKDSPFDLVAYSDSGYAVASLDRKSTTSRCQFLRCILISWQCKKQTVVATSSIEAEYVLLPVVVHKCYGFRIKC